MERHQRIAILCKLIDELRTRGSWCGMTHLQKTTYFLQNVFGMPLGLEFVLYKHGPFCFELRDEVAELRADGIILLESVEPPFGPRLRVSGIGKSIQDSESQLLTQYESVILSLAEFIGCKGVGELERLSTAAYVTNQVGASEDRDKRASVPSQ